MRVPRDVANTVNAYLAFRAALRAVVDHNASGRPVIQRMCSGRQAGHGSIRATADDEIDLLR